MAQPTLTPREFAQKWGDNETKEKAVTKAAGGDGFADVWKKDFAKLSDVHPAD